MIIEVTENVYKGILLERVKGKGWKCGLGGQEYLFPNYAAAEAAIDEIFRDIKPIVTKHKGEKIQRQTDGESTQGELAARILEAFGNYVQQDRESTNYMLQLLNAQLQALRKADYAEVEYICTALIETLEEA